MPNVRASNSKNNSNAARDGSNNEEDNISVTHQRDIIKEKRHEFIYLTIAGVAVLFVIFIFYVLFIGFEGTTLHRLSQGKQMKKPMSSYYTFITALEHELVNTLQLPNSSFVLLEELEELERKQKEKQQQQPYYSEENEQLLSELQTPPSTQPESSAIRTNTQNEVMKTLSSAALATADLQSRQSTTDKAYNTFQSEMKLTAAERANITSSLATMRSSTEVKTQLGSILNAYLSIVQTSLTASLRRLYGESSSWFQNTILIQLIHSNIAALNSMLCNLVNLNIIEMSENAVEGEENKAQDNNNNENYKKNRDQVNDRKMVKITSEEAYMLKNSVALARATFAIGQDLMAPYSRDWEILLNEGIKTEMNTIGFTPDTTSSSSVSEPNETVMESLLSYLHTYAAPKLESNVFDSRAMSCFCIGCVLVLLALLANAWVIKRHWSATATSRALVNSFEDENEHCRVREAYLPLLQELRAVKLPEQVQTEVEREYAVAAHFLDTLRISVSQLLFGEPQRIYPRHTTLLDKKVRLKSGNWSCPFAVVMEIGLVSGTSWDMISSINELEHNSGVSSMPMHLAMFSSAYNIIVQEVNLSGGVVLGFSNGAHVMTAWNVNGIVPSPALTAVRTGELVRRKLLKCVPNLRHIYMCVVSGSCVLSNSQVGGRMCPVLAGTMLSRIQRLRVMMRSLNTPLIMDTDTFRALPLRARELCKPVIIMRTAPLTDSATMKVYCVEDDAEISQEQMSLYTSGFFLYQNNMIAEAVEKFKQYITLYPHDRTAEWLLNHILIPRQFLFSRTKNGQGLIDDDEEEEDNENDENVGYNMDGDNTGVNKVRNANINDTRESKWSQRPEEKN